MQQAEREKACKLGNVTMTAIDLYLVYAFKSYLSFPVTLFTQSVVVSSFTKIRQVFEILLGEQIRKCQPFPFLFKVFLHCSAIL